MRSLATQTAGASFPVWWLERGATNGEEKAIESEISRTKPLSHDARAPAAASMRNSWEPMTRRGGRKNDNLHPRYKHHHRASQTPRCCAAIGSPGGTPVHYRLINTCLEEQHACEWKIDTKSLRSKNTCLTRTYRPEFGDFLFNIRAQQSSDKRGGRSIGAAGGRGCIDAKLISTVPGLSVRLLSVTVGNVKRRVAHDFDMDGPSCRVTGMWSLEEAAENSREGAAVLIFRFGIAAVHAGNVQDDD